MSFKERKKEGGSEKRGKALWLGLDFREWLFEVVNFFGCGEEIFISRKVEKG